MQKIKLTVLQNLIEKKVTSKELDFILHISRFQNEAGEIRGVYYRDFSDCMSIQSFYDVKASLKAKGIIEVKKNSDIDYDITILNNDFTDKDFSAGYISTSHAIFKSRVFKTLKANEKLLIMDLMKITYSNRGSWQITGNKFFEKYQKLFGVTKRVIRNYLHSIKQFFHVSLSKFKYTIIPRQNIYQREPGEKSGNQIYAESVVRALCRRVRIKEYKKKELEDTAALIWQYQKRFQGLSMDIVDALAEALNKSLQMITENSFREKQHKLNPRLIHKNLLEML